MPSYLIAFVPTLAMITGLMLAIETVVHYTVNPGDSPNIKAFGISFNAAEPNHMGRRSGVDRGRLYHRA